MWNQLNCYFCLFLCTSELTSGPIRHERSKCKGQGRKGKHGIIYLCFWPALRIVQWGLFSYVYSKVSRKQLHQCLYCSNFNRVKVTAVFSFVHHSEWHSKVWHHHHHHHHCHYAHPPSKTHQSAGEQLQTHGGVSVCCQRV